MAQGVKDRTLSLQWHEFRGPGMSAWLGWGKKKKKKKRLGKHMSARVWFLKKSFETHRELIHGYVET